MKHGQIYRYDSTKLRERQIARRALRRRGHLELAKVMMRAELPLVRDKATSKAMAQRARCELQAQDGRPRR